ncbi:hypothetical protein [Streptomyces roseifaciens]|uniref:hypothetical protein n=1 Tax=Streptomyces roseifaciens TaxID=1488406 RepID=UPI0007180ED6|nr:hypothetical protein [Streptomyces roseifaciens]
MRARTVLPALAAITVAGLGLGAAAPAIAAPAATSLRALAVAADDGLDVHRGKFFSLGACQEAGQAGIERGHWDRYQCAKNWLWNLWSNR